MSEVSPGGQSSGLGTVGQRVAGAGWLGVAGIDWRRQWIILRSFPIVPYLGLAQVS